MTTKDVTVGNLTFVVRARTTLGIYSAIDEMEKVIGKDAKDFGFVADNFITADYNTVNLTRAETELTEDESALVEYFTQRNGSIAHNWELSQNILTIESLTLWSRAVQSTRTPLSPEKKDN